MSNGEKMKQERFERIYQQGRLTVMEIWVDRETGVNYLWHEDGYSGGLTPLLDARGNVVVTPFQDREKE